MKERHENLFKQLKNYREDTLNSLKSVSAAEAEIVPSSFNNNIRWNLGHVYLDQYLWIETLIKEKIAYPTVFHNWFGYGTNPSHFSSQTPSYQELKELLKSQPDFILENYQYRLEEVHPPIEMGMQTIEQVLIRTIFHEGIHFQTINSIYKRLPKITNSKSY
ncbi:DinB family protein [Bacillus sp. Marseille-P3800]|uniref:DinB family protein n=1 Tax=Bacillus sp. Marseille-P3800 TaxID=2014782 RepID=UPI000C075865|nr:DinB family protein [Bacillus sp. Marseille-P3800]